MRRVSSDGKTLTVGEKMVEEMARMAIALSSMHGVPRSVIVAYLRQRTHLPLRDITAVLDGLLELNKEFRR